MKTKKKQPEAQQLLRRNEQKWTKTLMDVGWTAVPSVLLECQQELELDATDINILFHLATYWWYADNHPHPSKATIAAHMGIDSSTVRRRIAKMEANGIIQRYKRFNKANGGQQSNIYKFDGLIKKATPLAKEALEEREERRKKARKRAEGKRIRLKVLDGGKE